MRWCGRPHWPSWTTACSRRWATGARPRRCGVAVRAGLRTRALAVRWLPRRRTPQWFRSQPVVRLHPDGYDVSRLGTFPSGCPVPPPR